MGGKLADTLEWAVTLRDSGTCADLLSADHVSPEQLTGDYLFVKQPLDSQVHCLPIAEVELEIKGLGILKTKAGVVDKESGLQYYLLGNKTQNMIDSAKQQVSLVNAVVTRSKFRNERDNTLQTGGENNECESEGAKGSNVIELEDEISERLGRDDDELQDCGKNDDIDSMFLPAELNDKFGKLARISREDFKREQENDLLLKEVWEKARAKKSHFMIMNNLLFRKTLDNRGGERSQLVIPSSFRLDILGACHEGISAHLGEKKTKDKVLRYYFWPNCIKDIEHFVKTCEFCQKIGKPKERGKAPLSRVPIIGEIFSKLSVDTVGPLPRSEKGNKYLLTVICAASRYPEAIPIPDIKSETIVEALMWVFSRLGYPREIQTDLGKSFVSNLTTAFLEKFGIKITHSSVCHPASNLIERWHRSVKRLLKVLCLENGASWEGNLPYALLALRTVTHDSTGFSPAELIHGKNLRTPETLLFEKWTGEEEENELITEYVFNLMNRLRHCQELAIENMTEAREKRKLWYDKKAVERNFKVGEEVLVLATSKKNKMSVNWIGPGKIESKISDTNYIVNVPGRREKSQIYHVNLLKRYYKRSTLVNFIAQEIENGENSPDLDIEFPAAETENYDFEKVIKDSDLESRCTSAQIEQLRNLLDKYSMVFSNDPGRTDLVEHDIELLEHKPIRLKPYRASPRQTEILRKEIKRMLELNIIVEGESDFTSPMILVEAPGKNPRPCIDYRKLNEITKAEFFPLPNIEDRVEKVASAKYITVLDLTNGYWQIPLSPRAQKLAAFVTSFGSYLPLVMPFGLSNASYRFSKFMAKMLRGLEEFCLPYLDDTAVFSETWEDHLQHLEKVLLRIKEAMVKIKLAKCKFAQKTVKYLGHVVGEGRRKPAEAKIRAILELPTPKNKTEIRRCLGMAGYYSRYIKDYATVVEPLTRALKGKNKRERVIWNDEMNKAFELLKTKLTEKPILYAPNYSTEFIIQTDASDIGIGVVLAQRVGSEEHPIIYLSRKFSETEKGYSATERECAAIIFAIKKLRHYIDGQKFSIETDHNPLVFLKRNSGNNPRLLRWALTLQPYHYAIKHRPGRDIPHVDFLSRVE